MKKELRIIEIMEKEKVSRGIAELIFLLEACEKYNTGDIRLAIDMFYSEK